MVMNVGLRPTVNVGGTEDASVEVHVMHRFGAAGAAGIAAAAGSGSSSSSSSSFAEFYGARMRVVVTGFLRPEMRFEGLAALVSRIKADFGVSKAQLTAEDGPHAAARRDAFLM
jgi:riboflavin kinase